MAGKDWKEKYKAKFKPMRIDPLFDGNADELYPDLLLCKKDLCNNLLQQDFMVPELHYDEYIRYCSLLLDPASPIVREQTDIKARREFLQKTIPYRGHTDRRFEVNMLRYIYRNRDWTLLCSIQNTFDDYTEKVNAEIRMVVEEDRLIKITQIKTTMLKDMGDLIGREEALIKKIFYNDDGLIDTNRQMTMSPEGMAKFLQSGGASDD